MHLGLKRNTIVPVQATPWPNQNRSPVLCCLPRTTAAAAAATASQQYLSVKNAKKKPFGINARVVLFALVPSVAVYHTKRGQAAVGSEIEPNFFPSLVWTIPVSPVIITFSKTFWEPWNEPSDLVPEGVKTTTLAETNDSNQLKSPKRRP